MTEEQVEPQLSEKALKYSKEQLLKEIEQTLQYQSHLPVLFKNKTLKDICYNSELVSQLTKESKLILNELRKTQVEWEPSTNTFYLIDSLDLYHQIEKDGYTERITPDEYRIIKDKEKGKLNQSGENFSETKGDEKKEEDHDKTHTHNDAEIPTFKFDTEQNKYIKTVRKQLELDPTEVKQLMHILQDINWEILQNQSPMIQGNSEKIIQILRSIKSDPKLYHDDVKKEEEKFRNVQDKYAREKDSEKAKREVDRAAQRKEAAVSKLYYREEVIESFNHPNYLNNLESEIGLCRELKKVENTHKNKEILALIKEMTSLDNMIKSIELSLANKLIDKPGPKAKLISMSRFQKCLSRLKWQEDQVVKRVREKEEEEKKNQEKKDAKGGKGGKEDAKGAKGGKGVDKAKDDKKKADDHQVIDKQKLTEYKRIGMFTNTQFDEINFKRLKNHEDEQKEQEGTFKEEDLIVKKVVKMMRKDEKGNQLNDIPGILDVQVKDREQFINNSVYNYEDQKAFLRDDMDRLKKERDAKQVATQSLITGLKTLADDLDENEDRKMRKLTNLVETLKSNRHQEGWVLQMAEEKAGTLGDNISKPLKFFDESEASEKNQWYRKLDEIENLEATNTHSMTNKELVELNETQKKHYEKQRNQIIITQNNQMKIGQLNKVGEDVSNQMNEDSKEWFSMLLSELKNMDDKRMSLKRMAEEENNEVKIYQLKRMFDELKDNDKKFSTEYITQTILNFASNCIEFKNNKSNVNINFEINEVIDQLNKLKQEFVSGKVFIKEPEDIKESQKYIRKDPETGEITELELLKFTHNGITFDKETGQGSEVKKFKLNHVQGNIMAFAEKLETKYQIKNITKQGSLMKEARGKRANVKYEIEEKQRRAEERRKKEEADRIKAEEEAALTTKKKK